MGASAGAAGSDGGPGKGLVSAGVDVAEARKGLDLVVLDGDRRVRVSRGGMAPGELARLVLEDLRPDIVCIDSPSSWSRRGGSREGERQLGLMGIRSFRTGPDPGDHPFYRWMRVGIELFAALGGTYPLFRGGWPAGTCAEVFPHASAVLLAGRAREAGETKHGFRRRVLSDHGVSGAGLTTADRVDAALGALTGLLALGGSWGAVGDPAEGLILLPGPAPIGAPGPG